MTRRLLSVSLSALALALVACGTPVSSKADAAKAAQQLYGAGSAANSGTSSSPLLGGFDTNVSLTVTGKSGTAKVTVQASTGGTGADVIEEIAYDHFSADGKNTFNGTITQTVSAHGDATGSDTSIKMVGKVTMSGDYDSVLDVDYTESVKAGTSGVSIVLDGKIIADGTTYLWANETLSASAGI